MKRNRSASTSAFFNIRILVGLVLCLVGVGLAVFGLAHRNAGGEQIAFADSQTSNSPMRFSPTGGNPGTEAADLLRLEEYWFNRMTYPTGRFNPAWLRRAAAKHWQMQAAVPGRGGNNIWVPGASVPSSSSGEPATLALTNSAASTQIPLASANFDFTKSALTRGVTPLALSTTSFTSLGPLPEHMGGCSGCFDYPTTEGR